MSASDTLTLALSLREDELPELVASLNDTNATLYQAAAVLDLLYSGFSSGFLDGDDRRVLAVCELCGFALERMAETRGDALGVLAVKLGQAARQSAMKTGASNADQ